MKNYKYIISKLSMIVILAVTVQFFPNAGKINAYADNDTLNIDNKNEKSEEIDKEKILETKEDLYYLFPYLNDNLNLLKPKILLDSEKKDSLKKEDMTIGKYRDILTNAILNNKALDKGEDEEDKKSSLGGKVWEDLNGNGLQDGDEFLVSHLEVKLLDENKKEVESTYTDIFGRYIFNNLNEGNYYIQVVLDNKYTMFTGKNVTEDINKDNEFDQYGISNKIAVSEDFVDYSIDAGIMKPITIGDFVWNDINWNGIKDDGEPGIEGIYAGLYKDDDLIEETETNENGYYSFKNLKPGKYRVKFLDLSHEYIPTKINNEENIKNSIISVINENGFSKEIVLKSGDIKEDVDGGFHKSKIGDLVWDDKNFNGIQDEGEEGLEGVKVKLYEADGTFVKETKTNEKGRYEFLNINPGCYYIKVEKVEGYNRFSPKNVDEKGKGSIVNDEGKSKVFYLREGENFDGLDVGLAFLGEIEAKVWEDSNYNGMKDENEKVLQGVTVKLLNSNGNEVKDVSGKAVKAKKTTSDGKVYFEKLPEGEYKINVEMPKGYKNFTKQNIKLHSNYSNVNAGGFSDNFNIKELKDLDIINAGLVKYGSIGNKVWNDLNKNGKLDDGEEGVKGVKVFLCDGENRLLAIDETDDRGNYKFDNLEPGKYYIKFQPLTGWNGVLEKKDDANFYRSRDIILSSGENDNTIDLALYKEEEDIKKEETNISKDNSILDYIILGGKFIILGTGATIGNIIKDSIR